MATRSRVKFGGQDNDDGREIEDLRAAVKEDCVKLCTQHFGLLPDLQLVSVDTIGQDEAYRAAQAQLQRAAPLFKDIAKTAQAIKGLGEKGRVSSEAVKVAERIQAQADTFLTDFQVQPTRPYWLSRVAGFFDLDKMPADVLTAISFLAGWWPQAVDEASVREKGASPAGVFRLEAKNIQAALRARTEMLADPRFKVVAGVLGIGTPPT